MLNSDITDKSDLQKAVKEVLSLATQSAGHEQATVLALHGDLGAGKTTFTQTLAAELGVTSTVTSPTFVIMKKYQTANPQFKTLIHIDAYRLNHVDELRILGFADELSRKDTIICIEWAEKVADLLPVSTINLSFELNNDGKRWLIQK